MVSKGVFFAQSFTSIDFDAHLALKCIKDVQYDTDTNTVTAAHMSSLCIEKNVESQWVILYISKGGRS